MALLNLVLPTLTDAETAAIRTHFDAIKVILAPKFTNLEPDDRKQYGSINEQNMLVVNKVKEYHGNAPDLASPNVDWTAYDNHYMTRGNYRQVAAMAAETIELCNDPRTLVDYTLYGLARQDYRYTKFSAEDDGHGSPGFETKYDDLKQFFAHDNPTPPAP